MPLSRSRLWTGTEHCRQTHRALGCSICHRTLPRWPATDPYASIAVTKDRATPPGYARWGAPRRLGRPAPFLLFFHHDHGAPATVTTGLLFRPYGPKTPCRTPNFSHSLWRLGSSAFCRGCFGVWFRVTRPEPLRSEVGFESPTAPASVSCRAP